MRRNIPVFVCVLAGALVFPSLAPACGKERWGIKTLADKDAARISEQPVPATVAELNTIAAPTRKDLPENSRLVAGGSCSDPRPFPFVLSSAQGTEHGGSQEQP